MIAPHYFFAPHPFGAVNEALKRPPPCLFVFTLGIAFSRDRVRWYENAPRSVAGL